MTEREIRGYHEEIDYQKRMLSNLQRFMTLSVLFSTTGIVLIYFFHLLSLLITILGIILLVIGVISSLVFGYGIYKGQKNIDNLINIFKEKLND
ncbi:PTS fructose transporter subunit IA [Eggerthia catenaformis]|nr:PTS fructose transporter subunit IA [Eggerthia catenaformis]